MSSLALRTQEILSPDIAVNVNVAELPYYHRLSHYRLIDGNERNELNARIERLDTIELLRTDRITLVNGKSAQARSTTARYLPVRYTSPDSNGISVPEFGEPTDIGVVIDLTCTVLSAEPRFRLQSKPLIRDLLGFDDYSYVTEVSGEAKTIPIKMPIVATREVELDLILSDDQSVVVHSGLRVPTSKTKGDRSHDNRTL